MRKAGKKSMAGGIVALSLILTGTGYAYWTDTLNVTTKATTGNLAVTFADLGLYAQYGNEMVAGGWSIVDGIGENGFVDDEFFQRGSEDYNIIAKEGTVEKYQENSAGYNNVEFDAQLGGLDGDVAPIPKNVGQYTTATTNGSDKIYLEVLNMYPGYAQAFRTDILNVGEIAAKLSNMNFKVDAGENAGNVEDMLGIAILVDKEQYSPAEAKANVFKLCASLGADAADIFTVGEVDFLRLSALKKLDPKVVADAIANAEILSSPDSDNRMDLYVGVAMDKDAEGVYTTGTFNEELGAYVAENDDTESQNKGVTIELDLLWDQFNVGKDAGTPNILGAQNAE